MSIPVLYIGGWGRSGSTLIGNILGSIDPFIHLGELVWIWEHGWKSNHLCGCGIQFQSCSFWKSVLDDFLEKNRSVDIDKIIFVRNRYFMSNINFLKLMLGKINDEIEEYLYYVHQLYKSIWSKSESKVIVDSSKVAFHFLALSMINDIELYLIHLVRDARGCAYSWCKHIYREDAESGKKIPFVQYSPAFSTSRWCLYNTFFEIFKSKSCKHALIKYESFIRDITSYIKCFMSMLGVEKIKCCDVMDGDGNVKIGINHTVWGNPSRLKRGKIKIRLDDAWRREMPWKDRLVVTALAWPWLLKYGYL
ncbi:hypothetical protein [Rhodothermus profundi]|uniref:Sulfotransferase family protein n=1 Tax=Rhodothermus profundi TaxID=633813 RepID=A0A1M6XK24_9BACT|nr:hypothetical protein [Rhodothermus profundi]SHL06350.1 hypothetical protein SAMN04488087_2632 [Rhodothermus profundi]